MIENRLSDEGKYVLNLFEKNFERYKDIPMAIYGIGGNTKAILDNIKGYNIVGLMDAGTVGETIYGYSVLSYDEVIEKVKIIVIVAQQNVVNIIHKRIEFLENENKTQIYNIDGDILGKINEEESSKKDIYNYNSTEDELIDLIDTHDIISFDVFDTLIMRKTLRPLNIFDVVEREISEKLNIKIDFKRNRIDSETELNKTENVPTINLIYEVLQDRLNINNELRESIKLIELETELKYITPRLRMVEILEYSFKNDKEIYLLSDMYLPKEFIQKLLKKCSIKYYKELIVSCEINKNKNTGKLYDYYKTLVGSGKKLLHIGDNYNDDIKMSKKYDINSFHILSSYEMFLTSSFKDLLVHIDGIDDDNILGLFASKAFNDPFIINDKKGRLKVDNLFNMGYLFIGPVVLNFAIWLIQQLENSEYDRILFTARDGYLIEKAYKILINDMEKNLPENVYFKTSRRAVTVPSIYNEDDIKNIMKYPFKGTVNQLLKERFGVIVEDKNKTQSHKDIGLEKEVLRYKKSILDNAKEERKHYMKYIEQCGLLEDKNIAIFDFVSSGTVQCYLSKLIEKDLTGYYFVKMNSEQNIYNKKGKVISLFGEASPYNMTNNVSKYFMFLESIFTDPNPTLIKVNKDGSFKYSDVEEKNFDSVKECQDGIIKFVKDMMNIDKNILKRDINTSKTDEMLGMLNSDNCIFSEEMEKLFYLDSTYTGESKVNVWEILI